ncbi:hypothetical protein CG723_35045 [Streptomyces sp. CB01635]|uniref:hypothetical protein n=1 Tax=unclassified Streptomyces TaxID=2593676 RepID=UPI000C27CC04|nr:hypothetical protein [Streptomyces sp. CB01635]PJN07208.1 hypothetical protein CG723_35045 [Streptomyces sp. CB01635]
MRIRTAAVLVAALVSLVSVAACDTGTPVPEDLVVTGSSPAAPYHGPLKAKAPDIDGDEDNVQGGGASVLALECAGKPYQGGSGDDGWGTSDGADSPDQALSSLVADEFSRSLPRRGYRVEREAGRRVLYSYDVGSRTRVAVIVAKDLPRRPGWGLETYAQCDPSEFARRDRAHLDIRVWVDRKGRPAPASEIFSTAGPEHCDWQSAEFLHLGDRQYLRDPEHSLPRELLHSSYGPKTRLPQEAMDTGYRDGRRQLWLSADKLDAYVRTGSVVERWPGAIEPIACR